MPPRPSALALPAHQHRPLRALLSVARAVAADPSVVSHQAAARHLDRHLPPQPVDPRYLGRLPGWFVRSWRRNLPQPRRRGGDNARYVGNELRATLGPLLDHWGTVFVHGVAVFQSEPYATIPTDPVELQASLLSDLTAAATWAGGVGLYSRRSSWFPPHTVRLLIAPYPDRLAEAMRGAGNKTFWR